MIALTATVLRNPERLLDEGEDAERLAWLAPRLLAIALLGGAVFGAVIGSYRGGIQLAYAAIKMPLLLGIPVLVCLPAVHALHRACRVDASYRRLALAGLVATARTAVLAAALGPVVWLLYSVGLDYHLAVLLLAGCLALTGLPGLALVARAMPGRGELRWMATVGSVLLLGLVTAQTGWVLRPFVARPNAEVAFLRPVEADVLSALAATGTASIGFYQHWEPRSSGLVGRGLRSAE